MLLDHLNAGAAVLGELINVGAFHEAHANISVGQAVRSALLAISISFEASAAKHAVERLDVVAGKDGIGRLREFRVRCYLCSSQ